MDRIIDPSFGDQKTWIRVCQAAGAEDRDRAVELIRRFKHSELPLAKEAANAALRHLS